MRLLSRASVLLATFVLAGPAARSQPFEPWTGEKELVGTLGDGQPLRLVLRIEGRKVSGTSLRGAEGPKRSISGTFEPPSSLRLEETGADGERSSSATASFVTADWLEGSWRVTGEGMKRRFRLAAEGVKLPPEEDTLSGRYKSVLKLGDLDRRATFDVRRISADRVRVKGATETIEDPETSVIDRALVDGTGSLADGVVDLVSPSTGKGGCHLRLLFADDGLRVSGTTPGCAGRSATFDGRYRRVGPPQL